MFYEAVDVLSPCVTFFDYYTLVGCIFVTVAISGTLVLFKSI